MNIPIGFLAKKYVMLKNTVTLLSYIIEGYTFDHAIIFKDFINKLYQIRTKYPKSNPMKDPHF